MKIKSTHGILMLLMISVVSAGLFSPMPVMADRIGDVRSAYDAASSAYFSGLADRNANVAALKKAKDDAFVAYQAESRAQGVTGSGILGNLDVVPGDGPDSQVEPSAVKSSFRETLDRQYEAVHSRIQNFLSDFGGSSKTGAGDKSAGVKEVIVEKGLDEFLTVESSPDRLLEAAEFLKSNKDFLGLARVCARLAETAPKNSDAARKAFEYLALAEASMLLDATDSARPSYSDLSSDEVAARAAEVRGKIEAKNKELADTGFFNFFRKARLNSEIVALQTEYSNLKAVMAGGSTGTAKPSTVSRTARTPGKKYAVCVKDSYNVRSGPWGDKVGEIRKGESVEITGQEKDDKGKVWYRVSFGGKTGYCYFEGLRMEEVSGGSSTPAFIAPGVSDEFQTSIVKALFKILHEGGEIPTAMSGSRLYAFFVNNKILAAGFPILVETKDKKGMAEVITGLSRMLNYTPLRKALNSRLAAGDYAGAVAEYLEKYQDNYDDPAIYGFNESAVPTIMINIPSRQLRVYRDGFLIHDFPTVPGKPNPSEAKENTQTRVGNKFRITEWCKDYTTSAYPDKWSDNIWKGAFGKFAAKIGPNGNGQHIHGTTGPEWIGNLPINYAPGSHGCSRLANKNVTILRDVAPVGSKVIKTYCVQEIQSKKGIFGESFTKKTHGNAYNYDISKGGWFIPGAGVLIDHAEPTEAIR